jgi:hypothetical protein
MEEHSVYLARLMSNPGILTPDRPIAFNRDFVRLGIRVNGALFLSQALYWSKRTKNTDGWFYKTVEDWEEETGLTREEQSTVKNKLTELGVLSIEKRGLPATNHFKVNVGVLALLLVANADDQSAGNPSTGQRESLRHSNTEITTESTIAEEVKSSQTRLPSSGNTPLATSLRVLEGSLESSTEGEEDTEYVMLGEDGEEIAPRWGQKPKKAPKNDPTTSVYMQMIKSANEARVAIGLMKLVTYPKQFAAIKRIHEEMELDAHEILEYYSRMLHDEKWPGRGGDFHTLMSYLEKGCA